MLAPLFTGITAIRAHELAGHQRTCCPQALQLLLLLVVYGVQLEASVLNCQSRHRILSQDCQIEALHEVINLQNTCKGVW